MKLIPGRKIADKILSQTKAQIAKSKNQPTPRLAVILVGSNPASHLYVSIKEKKAKQIGINFKKYLLPTHTSQQKIIGLIKKLNQNKKTTAILIQLPLPKHLNTDRIISSIDLAKDADGIHPDHLKMLEHNQTPPVLPATTGAIIEALKYTHTNLKNKSITIIGKSKIVGLPTYYYLKHKCRTIAIYDSSTKNLAPKTSKADIVIVAIGSPKFITDKYIKPNAIVIDVGINPVKSPTTSQGAKQFDGVDPVKSPTTSRDAKQFDRVNQTKNKTVGDVDLDSIKNKAQYLTPVPKGIGPITVSILLNNTYQLYKNINK